MGADLRKEIECIVVTFNNIKTDYSVPAPPNGMHYLYPEGEFLFHTVSGWFDIQFFISEEYLHYGEYEVHCDSLYGLGDHVFQGWDAEGHNGLFRMNNDNQGPYGTYYGGFAVCAARYTEIVEPNADVILDALGFPVNSKPLAELMGGSNDKPAVRIADKTTGSNVYISLNND